MNFNIKDVKVRQGIDCGSNHHLLKAKIVFPHLERPNSNKGKYSEEQANLEDIETPIYLTWRVL